LIEYLFIDFIPFPIQAQS